MSCAFDSEKYFEVQCNEINKRINKFGDKLYLEFGGKLFDDFHASRVLPGFEPDSKLKVLLGLKDKAEIVIVVNSNDIQDNKIRGDSGITYEDEVIRLIESFNQVGLYVGSVVLSRYQNQSLTNIFKNKLEKRGVKTYLHYSIAGYPSDISNVVSEDGFGKNDYIDTTKPLIIVTAPGPGSGKLATCLSQLYHDNKRGIRAGYAKYETFPIWNIGLKHPINLAYEAATVDLNDVNMIDPFHLEKYGIQSVNYNRDVEAFPLLSSMFERIYGFSPYASPTEMGVNMAGFCIFDDEKVREACKDEIIRRYYQTKKNNFLGKLSSHSVAKAALLMNQVDADVTDRPCVDACLEKEKITQTPCIAIQLNDGRIVTGKTSSLFRAPAAAILNCLKALANIDDNLMLLSPNVIEPIRKLKTSDLGNKNPRLLSEEILIALAINANTNPIADLALKQLPKLKGAQAHSSVILQEADLKTLKKLGIQVTEEAILSAKQSYSTIHIKVPAKN
jgi:uncharacterized protein (UPF0371 family)